jgi:DNA polymerase
MGIDTWLLRSNNKKNEQVNHSPPHFDVALCSSEDAKVKLLIIADGLDDVEEGTALSFPSKTRKLFHKMLSSIHLSQEEVGMISSINREHLMSSECIAEETARLRDAVSQQMIMMTPKVILVLGDDLGQCFLKDNLSLGDRPTEGHVYENIPVIVSYHPKDLLEKPLYKKKAYHDWLLLKQLLMNE